MNAISSTPPKPPIEILIAEDSATQRAQLQHLLEEHSYAVVAAPNGKEALAAARRRKPTLVISDITMPELDGYGLCKAIKTDDRLKDVPLILLTTLADPRDILKALECGADNFLRKPYEEKYLLSRIEYMLMNHEMRKNHKMQMGVELTLDGQRHFITTERQQVLDMLISTYEQAVAINADLVAREGDLEHSNRSLAAMFATAGELNKATTVRAVIEAALDQAMAFPGVRAGWLTVLEDGEFHTLGTLGLPPALQVPGAMDGTCECRRRLLAGELPSVTNIAECERVQKAQGDTQGMRSHASVPIRSGDETLGILNLVGNVHGLFSDADARNLDILGVQLGAALSRARLHESLERKVEARTARLTSEIAERQRAEQEVRELNASLEQRVAERTRQLEAASRAKSDFLANMSHELRTPLNSIIGFSEMLRDGVLGTLEAKQKGFITDIFDAGTHLLSLINDILDLSKVEAGMLRLDLKAVDIAALLKASNLVVREKAAMHRIRIDTQVDAALGAMLTDERKLKQIIYNLLANAVKFTADGGAVTLRARRCTRAEIALGEERPGRLVAPPEAEDAEFVEISVEDTGAGIAEAHLPLLFEPFTQVDSSATRRQGGTGLGLSLVRRLAELHGGTVGVASRPGEGSRFSVWLPYREAALPSSEGPAAPTATAPSAPAQPLALVVEDDDRIAELITAQLRAEGFSVMRAATAEEGLVRAAKRPPQLITLDIFLPSMDGWEFMNRLKADPRFANTPVVVITVSEDLARGVALGAQRVLQKPFPREELVAVLAGLVEAQTNGGPPRVLVVDDNVKAVELLATQLKAEGYRVMRAYGGAEAIEVARTALPDLVILDLIMPEVSGFEVARALRETERTARIPILVLSAKDLTAEDRARLSTGVNAVLAKSTFGHGELLAELRRALHQHAARREGRR